jgi:hypothetical protein
LPEQDAALLLECGGEVQGVAAISAPTAVPAAPPMLAFPARWPEINLIRGLSVAVLVLAGRRVGTLATLRAQRAYLFFKARVAVKEH